MKKIILLLLILSTFFLYSCTVNSVKEINYITDYYAKKSVSDFLDVTAICYSGDDIARHNFDEFLSDDFDIQNYAKLSQRIIGLKMLENRGYDISGFNVDSLASSLLELTVKDDNEGYIIPPLQRIYGIYALKLSDADYPEESIEKFAHSLLEYQNEDGGFSVDSAEQSDVETTSAIIPIFCYFKQNKLISGAIHRATNYLKNSKNKNDTYSFHGVPSCISTANALSSFMALGFDEKSENIGDITLALATFRLADGSYSNIQYSSSDFRSCAVSLIAYRDFENKSSLWLSVLENKI